MTESLIPEPESLLPLQSGSTLVPGEGLVSLGPRSLEMSAEFEGLGFLGHS